LINAPILKIAYLEKDLLVCTKIFKEGISGVVMKEG